MAIGRFIGTNKIVLNEATMMQAVQMWLDSFSAGGPKARVVGVTRAPNAHDSTFEVLLQEVKKEEESD